MPTTLDHLRRAILEHPFQDEPRLIYADALSETGRPQDWDMAEAIRGHVQTGRAIRCERPGFATWEYGGLVSDLVGPLDRILAELGLWAIHPITDVMVTDKTPSRLITTEACYSWWVGEPGGDDEIPEAIWNRLTGELLRWHPHRKNYRDRATAAVDLSRAIVAEGRHLAGLPPLVWPQS